MAGLSSPGTAGSSSPCVASPSSFSAREPASVPTKKGKGKLISEEMLELQKEEFAIFKDFVEQSQKSDAERNQLIKENNEITKKFLEFFMSQNQ